MIALGKTLEQKVLKDMANKAYFIILLCLIQQRHVKFKYNRIKYTHQGKHSGFCLCSSVSALSALIKSLNNCPSMISNRTLASVFEHPVILNAVGKSLLI